MESEINLWVKNHKEEINSFYEIINVYKENINSKIDEYERLMTDKIKDKKIRTWNGEHLSSIKYIVFDLGCNLDVSLDGAGWNISINMWKKSKRSIIKNELFENNYNILKEKDGHVYLQQFNYDINIDEVVNKALDLYNLVNSIRN